MSGPSTHLQFVPARVLSSFRYDGLAIGKEDMSQLPMVSTRQRRHLGNFGQYFTERKALAKPTSTENCLIFVRCAQQSTRRRYPAFCCEMWPSNNIVCKITNKLLVITSPKVICQSARDIDTCRERSSTILWESGSKSAGEPNQRLKALTLITGPRIWLPKFDVIILEAGKLKINKKDGVDRRFWMRDPNPHTK